MQNKAIEQAKKNGTSSTVESRGNSTATSRASSVETKASSSKGGVKAPAATTAKAKSKK